MIVASAIKFFYEDDKEHRFPQIWTGLRHCEIFERMFKMGVKYDKESHVQGFVDSCNRFMDRYDAAGVAFVCKQVTDERFNKECAHPLYSEDIWPEED